MRAVVYPASYFTISGSHVTRVVVDGMSSLVFAYKRVGLQYSKLYLSKEFKERLEKHWGRRVITCCF